MAILDSSHRDVCYLIPDQIQFNSIQLDSISQVTQITSHRRPGQHLSSHHHHDHDHKL